MTDVTQHNYPDDDNGNVLRGMLADGDDLSQPRDIGFTVVLPTSDAVQEFGSRFYNLGLQVKAKKSGTVPELPWDVTVTVNMLPSYEGITEFEQKLEKVAAPLGGRNDGWACFQV
jgi:hypothetical protein